MVSEEHTVVKRDEVRYEFSRDNERCDRAGKRDSLSADGGRGHTARKHFCPAR